MTSMESKNEMFVMVLADLAGICKKLADNSAAAGELRTRARRFAHEFDTLVSHYGIATPAQHVQGEELLFKITRFLPDVLEGTGRVDSIATLRNVA